MAHNKIKLIQGRVWVAFTFCALLAGCAAAPNQQLTVFATRAGETKSDDQSAYDLVASLKSPDSVMIIYDASGSMRWPVKQNGAPRYKEAQKAFADYIKKVNPKNNVGMIVFGSKHPSGIFDGTVNDMEKAKISCNSDIDVRVPLAKFSNLSFKGEIDRLQSSDSYRGDTPIGNAISKATEILNKSPGTRKHIILITDGAEECWRADGKGVPGSISPKEAVKSATTKGVEVSIISFGVGKNKEGIVAANKQSILESLRTLATGVFIEANTGDELAQAFLHIEVDRFPFTLLGAKGEQIGRFTLGQKIAFAPPDLLASASATAAANLSGNTKNNGKNKYTITATGERDFKLDIALPSDKPAIELYLGLRSRDDTSPDLAPDMYLWKQ